jgi:hypothetical protein
MAYIGKLPAGRSVVSDSSGKLVSQSNQTIFDVDFTKLSDSTQSLSNGNVTIGGVTYTVQNATNASSIQFVNGSGFAVTAKSVGGASSQWDYNGGSPNNQRTAPVVLLPFSSITSHTGRALSSTNGIRAFLYVTSQSFGSADTVVFLSIDNNGSAGSTMYTTLVVRGWIGTGTPPQCNIGSCYVIAGNVNNNSVGANVTPSNCNVIGVEVDSSLPRVYTTYYGPWTSGWPAFSSLTQQTGVATTATTSVDVQTQLMKAVAMAFAGETDGTGAVVSRLRVDIW